MSSNIKLYISCHKPSELPKGDCFYPIQVGAAIAKSRFPETLHDDEGENISEKNHMYCEMTAQYWAWKNEDADYYGFFHYRRYLNFSRFRFPKDAYGSVLENRLDCDALKMYGLQENSLCSMIKKYDLIIPEAVSFASFPERPRSMWDHWEKAKDLRVNDLKTLLSVVARMQPQYYNAAKEYLDGDSGYFCNLYIMSRSVFHRYCEWLFPMLFEIEKETDYTDYSVEGQRTIGHLAERLFGIYISYLRQHSPEVRIKELQMVLFRDTELRYSSLPPAFPAERTDAVIPVVFAANNVFAPVCAVAIQSIIQHANPDSYYDIVILESDITPDNKKMISGLVDRRKNLTVRFFNALALTKEYSLVANEHITVETYYRFLIQDILPQYDKVLYLDGDLVCERDVAELFHMDIEGYMLAAAHDPDFCGQMNMPNSDALRYAVQELKLEEPYDYFQAGVLLLNTKEMREAYSLQQWLTFASKRYRYSDQDVLNRYCQGRVKYMDMAWNMLIDCDHYRVPVVINAAKGDVCRAYHEARKDPHIIHFAGFQKPWKQRDVDFEEAFWKYARFTPYYEKLLFNVVSAPAADNGLPPIGVKGAVKIYIRKKVNKWFPAGTKRRNVMHRLFGRMAHRMGI